MRLIKGSPLAGLSAIAVLAVGLGAAPALAQSDDFPTIDNRPGASIPPGPVPRGNTNDSPTPGTSSDITPTEPATAPAAPTKPAQTAPAASTPKKAAAAHGKTETLPWANAPKVPAAPPAPGADSAALDAAAAQCSGLFEAACRDLKTCAWIADVTLEDGTRSPARCVARPPAPPKKTAKKSTKPKKTDAAPAAPAAKPAPEPEKKSELAPEPAAAKTAATEPQPEQAPEPQKEKKGPIVVTAPPTTPETEKGEKSEKTESRPGPSFGTAFGGMGDGDNGVVVTIPSQQ